MLDELLRAAEAFAQDRERDAMRILRPLRKELPEAASVRELYGLCLYRAGRYREAAEELDEYVAMTGSLEQHPPLMDSHRALRHYGRVDELWDELAAASPSAALVTEGRIVLAGSLADRGRLRDAVRTLERRSRVPQRVREHHLRLWYALADLYERTGDVPRARSLFQQIRRYDASFADVAERLSALGSS
ncbi:MAG TPA: tetratricopeptide repeat protein [Acidimicrobiia bacterium]|jgi:tetratricopeptide (TPR) repeat protein